MSTDMRQRLLKEAIVRVSAVPQDDGMWTYYSYETLTLSGVTKETAHW